MTEANRDFERITQLLEELIDGQFNEAQVAELESLLRSDERARALYYRHVITHAMLHWKHGTTVSGAGPTAANPSPIAAPIAGPQSASTPLATEPGRPMSDKPSVFGFLGSLGGPIPSFSALLVVVVAIVLGAMAVVSGRFGSRGENEANSVTAAHGSDSRGAETRATASLDRNVARLTNGVDCKWKDGHSFPQIGEQLSVGQSLQLVSGVAEITFDVGARVIVQSPAALTLESAKTIRLDAGKLTAAIATVDARGFKVLTPGATFVDLGTEFGVEVSAGGTSKVHVFKGEVDVALNTKDGMKLPPQRLVANSGARLEGEAPRVTFVDDTGDSFMRSMDDADRDLHVVTYWRFEDQPLGTLLPDTDRNTTPVRATSDSTYNGNDLFVWSPESRPLFSGDVPVGPLQSGAANRGCLDLTDPGGVNKTRPEVYTNSRFSYASPIDIQKINPPQWTIEASVKVKELDHRGEVIVARNGTAGQYARLTLRINHEDKFSVDYIDTDERHHVAAAKEVVELNHWYNLVARSDGKLLQLFVDREDGQGYRLIASEALPSDGSTALGSCGDDCSWTVGRVRIKTGTAGGAFFGWIDEVRISDVAVDPSQFLFAKRLVSSRSASEAPTNVSAQAED